MSESSEKGGGPTGPRTPKGKDNSKVNATTHGIFSKAVVLNGESRADFELLQEGLREACWPNGTLEDILVQKLAMILWRHRRLFLAEQGEFLKNVKLLNSDQKDEAKEIEASGKALLGSISNPKVLDRCLELLAELREEIEADGFQSDRDLDVLRKIYGGSGEIRRYITLFDTYSDWLEKSERPEDEDLHQVSRQNCLKYSLEDIDAEIQRLKDIRKSQEAYQAERGRVDVLRRSFNEGPGLERLTRYEASLERTFDRTLAQLERLKRMRPVATSPTNHES